MIDSVLRETLRLYQVNELKCDSIVSEYFKQRILQDRLQARYDVLIRDYDEQKETSAQVIMSLNEDTRKLKKKNRVLTIGGIAVTGILIGVLIFK